MADKRVPFDPDFDLGGPGIDTDLERSTINYRPRFEYKKKSLVNYAPDIDPEIDQSYLDEFEELEDSSVVDTWEDAIDVYDRIVEVEKELSDKLAGVTIKVPREYIVSMQKAAEKFGFNIKGDEMPFELYKKTFDYPSSLEKEMIQDLFEDYMSDVNGSLNGEIYTDVIEMKKDWEDTIEFLKKGLLGQLVSPSQFPKENVTDDEAMILIKEKETQMNEEYLETLKVQKANEELLDELMMTESGSERYFQVEKEVEEGYRKSVELERRLYTKKEIVDLIDRKASDSDELIGLIEKTIDFDPYEEDKKDLVYHFMRQFSGTTDANTGMKKIQAVLKLSIDDKKDNVNEIKANLRGIAGQEIKQKAYKRLVNGIFLKNEVFGEVYDVLNYFEGIPSIENFEVLTNHISNGMKQAKDMYLQQASDYFKIHAMDSQQRSEKITSVIDKDAARQGYKLMGNIVSHINSSNETFPSEDELSDWLNRYMEEN